MISQSGKNTDPKAEVKGFLIQKEGESMYCIENYDRMDPFLMSIVSSSDLWMYLSSRGGLTAGRQNYNNAIFPYETDDKIHVADEITGPKTVIRLQREGKQIVWEPFSDRYQGDFTVKRSLCKNITGNKIIFEEENLSLGLAFSYYWTSCDELGWVRKSELRNLFDDNTELDVTDGLLNVLPWGITRDTQSTMSTLMDAYKIAEILPDCGLALYRMSSIPVDRAEPSEALRANTVWSTGLKNTKTILGSDQLANIRKGRGVINQHLLLGQRTSFLIHSQIILPGKGSKTWYIMADVAKDSSDVVFFQKLIQSGVITAHYIEALLKKSEAKLLELVTMADGIQETGDLLNDRRHFANVMFNIMRGGIFEQNYEVELSDFLKHVQVASKNVYQTYKSLFEGLNPFINIQELITIARSSANTDFLRLTLEYLPLSFSRRHGDPSRPWNYFDINVKNADGTPSLDYQGNWRDIFQNWETLAFSFPAFLPGMIARFLNASTADGYNPYRIMRDGFDWEVPEPDNPWAFIGYWGDHQIIYLLRLLEMQEKFYPGLLAKEINQSIFVYANVPYRIKKHKQILLNPQDTIEFDRELNEAIQKNVQVLGTDGKLLTSFNGNLQKATFCEKAFLTLLTKISNLVPEAGIWLNTQRPEWNDANNALVGNGVSMVTLYYLRRYVKFLSDLVAASPDDQFVFSSEVQELFKDIKNNLIDHQQLLASKFSDTDRKAFIDKNGFANEKYREQIYSGFSANHAHLAKSELDAFLGLALRFIDHSILANERADGMYHSYNLLEIESQSISVDHLYLMLEGQVAILNSGVLSSAQIIKLLDGLFSSDLWRKDQQSFMLYPFRNLPNFLQKNIIPPEQLESSALLKQMIRDKNISIVKEDADGMFHFNAALKNSRLLMAELGKVPEVSDYGPEEKELILKIYEKVFNHRAFTGRSGSFYKYEGLGSIYWHMVSKLLLAVGENLLNSSRDPEAQDDLPLLKEYYYKIKQGIGIKKQPSEYGAFTTDPYSHTPSMMGAQQPGMTGQVKEDILSRFNELGLLVKNGEIHFEPLMLLDSDFSDNEELCFSFCNTPFVYTQAGEKGIRIYWEQSPEAPLKIQSNIIPADIAAEIFNRTDRILHVRVDM